MKYSRAGWTIISLSASVIEDKNINERNNMSKPKWKKHTFPEYLSLAKIKFSYYHGEIYTADSGIVRAILVDYAHRAGTFFSRIDGELLMRIHLVNEWEVV
jgi:hypothetical protein